MHRYRRPLVVTFASLALASLISYAALALTEPAKSPEKTPLSHDTRVSVPMARNPEAQAAEDFAKAKAEAAGGDPKKLHALALLYQFGVGTAKDDAEASRLHRVGAEKGDALCQYAFGCELLLGIGTKTDEKAGIAMLLRSAAQHNADAEYMLQKAYVNGTGVETDKAEARKWLLRAAEHGHHDARADIAEEILGEKDAKRYKSIANLVRPGALGGHARSCHIMSFVYAAGIGVKKNPVESMAWRLANLNLLEVEPASEYRELYQQLSEAEQQAAERRAKELAGDRPYKSAFARDPKELEAEAKDFAETRLKAEQGDAHAQQRLAAMYHYGRGAKQDSAEAARWCRKAAEQGHVIAQFCLAQTLRMGDGVERDAKEAFAWYMKAALQGNPNAEHAVSMCYEDGEGVKADPTEAAKWRRKAAEDGDPRSQCDLAADYAQANATPANQALALLWYRKAAEQLHPKGVYCLGLCYMEGRGVPKDRIEGLAWMFTRMQDMTEEEQDMVKKFTASFTEDELKRADQRGQEIHDQLVTKLKANLATK